MASELIGLISLKRRDLPRPSDTRLGGIGHAAAWERAAHATPHGKPILLENDPQRITG